MIVRGFILLLGIFVLWALLRLLMWARSSTDGSSGPTWTFNVNSVPTVITSAIDQLGIPTKIIFNGQEYSSPDEMPPDARQAYELAMSGVLTDADRDGVPDLLKSARGQRLLPADVKPHAIEDPAKTLRELQKMRDSGLITSDEYDAKKTEILNRM